MSKLEQLVSITHDFKQMPMESRQVVSGTNHFRVEVRDPASWLVVLPILNLTQSFTPQRGNNRSAQGVALGTNGIKYNRPKGAKAYKYGTIAV